MIRELVKITLPYTSPTVKERIATIYTLRNEFTIFYVGQTTLPLEQRLTLHKYMKVSQNRKLFATINKSEIVNIEAIEQVSYPEKDETELYWIYQFKEWGYPLLNKMIKREKVRIERKTPFSKCTLTELEKQEIFSLYKEGDCLLIAKQNSFHCKLIFNGLKSGRMAIWIKELILDFYGIA